MDLHENFARWQSQAKEQSINFGRGLQSLTDCQVINAEIDVDHVDRFKLEVMLIYLFIAY